MDQDNKDRIAKTGSGEDFEELLNQSMRQAVQFESGDRVEAVVSEVTKGWIFIDLGGKSDGQIAASEFVDDDGNVTVKKGDTINAHFLSSKNNEMLFTTRLGSDIAGGQHLEEAYHSGIPVEGLVEKEIKGGFQVKIAGNVHAFCPYSQLGLKRVEDTAQYLGQHLTFKIVEYGKRGRNIIVSNRVILEEERQKHKDALKESLEEGMVVSGHITSIKRFGAFVDIEGLEGLIPISEISWGRVEDIDSVLSVGQNVDVVIKKLDWANDKFSFSLKETLPDPWDNVGVKYPEGSIHNGKVSRLAAFGAFVTLEPGIDGLVHISELGKGKRINHPREVLQEEQGIEVKIARVFGEEKRLSLEMVSGVRDSEELDHYKKRIAESGEKSSGSLGTLGDILRKKMDEKRTDKS
jgi:small subunit ribosomal protein S1